MMTAESNLEKWFCKQCVNARNGNSLVTLALLNLGIERAQEIQTHSMHPKHSATSPLSQYSGLYGPGASYVKYLTYFSAFVGK
jgi:hypothetical protein